MNLQSLIRWWQRRPPYRAPGAHAVRRAVRAQRLITYYFP